MASIASPSSAAKGSCVCVTGASGFIASYLVKLLLEQGYSVKATVRDTSNQSKTAHLTSLPGAEERLTLIQADLFDSSAFDEAVSGCEGVFHTASPFFFKGGTEDNLVQPAVQGTLNVLEACARQNVKRVVLTSSMAAVAYNGGKLGPDHIYTHDDWSDEDVLRERNIWYPLSKTIAERSAWEFVSKLEGNNKFDLIVINPTLVLGPMLQPTLNTSSEMGIVDVRDVALAHILAMESQNASGRYVCMAASWEVASVCELLRAERPDLPIPTQSAEGDPPTPMKFDNSPLVSLGWSITDPAQTLRDTVASLEEKGFISTRSSE